MVTDPNMRCVCGYRRFRENVQSVEASVQRWLRIEEEAVDGGFGSEPFGQLFGGGSGGTWGLFELDVLRTHKTLACEKCGRARSRQVIGGLGAFGSYVLGNYVFVLVDSSILLSCMRLRFVLAAEDIVLDVTVAPYGGTTLPIELADPITTADSPPGGAVLATTIYGLIPDVPIDGDYTVSLMDVCADVEIELMTLTLAA